MRPRRLELEGFASFRERVIVDFQNADLFVLYGPTGAGKSSIIDAMTFALYGAVPRYDNQKLVAPVVSQGKNEARVRLDFTLGAAQYTAVRVVRRTGSGATTKEATLEDGNGRTLATGAAELSEAVERLIGLPFEHFTRCVVLPQGDFAEFLHAKPSDRQDLLVQLLGLDVYRRIAQSANQLNTHAANRALLIGERLGRELATATEEAVRAAAERVAALEVLLVSIDDARPELERLRAAQQQSLRDAADADARAASLESLRIPDGIERLARRAAEAAATRAAAERGLEAATRAREAVEREREALPERARLEQLLERHARRAELERSHETLSASLATAEQESAAARDRLASAQETLRAAEEELNRLRRARAAHHLAEHLHTGEPCPVCTQKVKELPRLTPPVDLEEAKKAAEQALAALDGARAAAQKADRNAAVRRSERDNLTVQLGDLVRELKDKPSSEEADAGIRQVDACDAALRTARRNEEDVRRAEREARDAAEDAEQAQNRARADYQRARDRAAAAGLEPPAATPDDLHRAWTELVAWAAERVTEQQAQAGDARAAAAAAQKSVVENVTAQRAACAEQGIDAAAKEPRDACSDALAAARAHAHRLATDLETALRLREEHQAFEKRARVAHELHRLLNATNFERWLMNRALRLLVIEATRVLRELSGGAYSLSLDARNEFQVIDHRNADEERMARTLSGGETFLAALALALALAEHVGELSSGGAACLDALFLDEGFGTLDADTLDTVASAIEELGARGRMVGLVTHVRELAERVPVRFEVRKVGSVSSVEKIVA